VGSTTFSDRRALTRAPDDKLRPRLLLHSLLLARGISRAPVTGQTGVLTASPVVGPVPTTKRRDLEKRQPETEMVLAGAFDKPLGAQASMPAAFRRGQIDRSRQAWMPALPGRVPERG